MNTQTIAETTTKIDSWNGIPLLKLAIRFYQDMEFIGELLSDQWIVISYRKVWYTLANNGGEITIHKINDPNYFAEFPTVYFNQSLNPETLIYRLVATLNGQCIDYQRVEDDILDILLAAK